MPTSAPPATSHPAEPATPRVLAVSIDGLTPEALRALGRRGAPAIWALIDAGASTLNARTEFEQTVTLPNHVGMVTGRRIDPQVGGHGVTWNEELPDRTVQSAAGGEVQSIFTAVHDSGGTTAVFAGKTKFRLFEASWPDAVDTTVITASMSRLGRQVARDVRAHAHTFTFLHLAAPDQVGHSLGWMSEPYLDAVVQADDVVGRLVELVRADPELSRDLSVVLTADHGGEGRVHADATDADDYTVPFVVVGPTVERGDLYALSPDLADPLTGRPTYAGPQPVRNCDLANVSTQLLGIDPVPGSTCNGYRGMPLEAVERP
ncbi:alkaline phosphatase family protein [Nocardioides sp.]|uniref:alkaline phosphatase family protein n=1 Tax=Nocardioides sp. TaxID=35761 RepID=UPI00271ED4AC|nr:alkaline phosphatase family protein [Nocardioides sp.]MDO9457222.1 alkaline phosphatase family protein [Nocardioides sp.]